MTGYTVHTGASKKFTEGWDNIFDKKKSAGKSSSKKKTAGKSPTSKAKATGKKKKSKKS